jgi:hypothetical protein
MRELTKSFVSASWAISLLGMKEGMALLSPQTWGRSYKTERNTFEPIAQAAVSQLDPSLQSLFRTGDTLQRNMVNVVSGFFDPGNWNPNRCTGDPASSGCGGQREQGWGPVPPGPHEQ